MKKNLLLKMNGFIGNPRLLLTMVFVVVCFISHSQTTVYSLNELLPYLDDDGVDVKLEPGTYSITAVDVALGKFGTTNFQDNISLLLFSGNNSTYDFTDVTLNISTEVFQSFGSVQIYEVHVTGNNNVLKNLTMVDDGSVYDQPKKSALGVCMDGKENRIEGFHMTVKGSFPYGYGDAFGKGGTYTIKHYKHSAFLIRGTKNHAKNCTIIHRSYGHAMFMQGASYPVIEGCYVEGEMRSTDDMLAEVGTGSPADEIDFMTEWGYKLPPGYMLSTGEGGIRAYNSGTTYIDGEMITRGTDNPTVLNCTIKNMRTGVTLAHATGTKYVEGCTVIGCENGYSLGSGDVVNCYADCAYGPVYSSTYESDKNFNADITIIAPEDSYYNGSHSVAYIGGSNHNITLRTSTFNLDENLCIKVGGDKNSIRHMYGNLPHQNNFSCTGFEMNNFTHFPIVLSDKSSNVLGLSGGMVSDYGTDNNIVFSPVSVVTIQAENYADMDGVDTELSSDVGAGENVTSVDVGDWLSYEVDIPYDGMYSMNYRLASETNIGEFSLRIDGENVENISFSATGSAQTWTTVSSPNAFYLSKGVHVVNIYANSAAWNINWLDVLLECAEVEIVPNIEVKNVFGTLLSSQQTTEISVFRGNTVLFKPEPLMGGSWIWTGPNGFSSNERAVELTDLQPESEGDYMATYTNDCGLESTKIIRVTLEDSFTMEAEDYLEMNGLETETTTDTQGERNIAFANINDWAKYDVNISQPAYYKLNYRLASEVPGDFMISIDGLEFEQVSFEATGGASTWSTKNSDSSIYLAEGSHSVVISSKSSGWKLNWIQFLAQDYVTRCLLPVSNDGFTVGNTLKDWSSGIFDTSCVEAVNVHVRVNSVGSMSQSDYLKMYYRVDGGDMIPIVEYTGEISETLYSVNEISGTTIELIIQANSESENTFYSVSDIDILESVDPYAIIQAEDFDDYYGLLVQATSDEGGGKNLNKLNDGEYAMYKNLDLTNVNTINARVATEYEGGFIEVRLNAVDGELVGIVEIPNTGDWQAWQTVSSAIGVESGIYDVYLVFRTENAYVGNLNWFQFENISRDPMSRMEAEDYDSMYGVEKESTSDIDGQFDLGWIHNDDWIMFRNIDMQGIKSVDMRLASPNKECFIEIRLDKLDGTLISTINVPQTGGWGVWDTVNEEVVEIEGVHDVYIVFKGMDTGYLCNINWLKFDATYIGINDPTNTDVFIYPNPVKDDLFFHGFIASLVNVYNSKGRLVKVSSVDYDQQKIDLSDLLPGIYFLKIVDWEGNVMSKKIVKQ
ncbi:carbohydrate-binding protein [Saccharicrinis fermentans]|uniref:Endo-1,4-beta-xylanase A n=1 Tax=Saccharicrinis fermentans DSM 9555 = JCM 21142 TaxID=869213 RepID=W7Y1Z6_9BACT|nr:carbohydrate-binding protein [Saccharicrinis fermentans]GAF01977.1 endo-1,4-beta-xylanase A precursor [Saccharicrinis fermentans DSM 9555 = JCM 21142]